MARHLLPLRLALVIVAIVNLMIAARAAPMTMAPRSMAPQDAPASAVPPLPLSVSDLPTPAEPWQVRMQRDACFGPCPVYGVVVHDDGSVDYQGREHVSTPGARQGKADPVALEALRKRLRRPGFSKLVGDYWVNSPACGHWTSDMAKIVIAVWSEGRWQLIKHDYGCSGAPRELHRLEDAIDKTARTRDLTGASPE